MKNAIESYAVIHNNPFILAPLFRVFYSTLARTPNNLLLSYLVLPLVLHPASREFLFRANVRSSIRTLKKKREPLFGLPERVDEYRWLTNLCIQHAVDMRAIEVTSDLSLVVNGTALETSLAPRNSVKAAKNLAKIFASYDVAAVYRLLGISSL